MKAELETTFERLAATLEGRAPQLTEALLEPARRELPILRRPEVLTILRDITVASIAAELALFRNGRRLPNALPEIDLTFAHESARLGGSVSGIMDGYRRGHLVQWEGWFELVDGEVEDPEARRELLQLGWRFFFEYAGRVSNMVAEEFTRERDRLLRAHEQRRVRLVQELLDGNEVDEGELGYPLAGHHVALVAWGPESAEVVRGLAERLDRALLLVDLVEDTYWAWLGGTRALGDRLDAATARLEPPEGVHLAFGDEAAGPDGFRRSHEQAGETQRTSPPHPAVTHFDDVALVSLASGDEDRARAFVARELAGIDGDDARSRRLRETLTAYFAAGHNAAATAARLGVHEQTIALRLRAVEERTGRAVVTRHTELDTALRLRELLTDQATAMAPTTETVPSRTQAASAPRLEPRRSPTSTIA